MKTKHYVFLALIGLIAFFTGQLIGRTEKPPGTVTETRETTVDTIPYYAPMPQSELALGTHRYTLPVYRFLGGGCGGEPRLCSRRPDSICEDSIISVNPYGTGAGGEPRCSKDSAIVELPIIQRHYADSTYEAWISGYAANLDSIHTYTRHDYTTVTLPPAKPKRWHLGITAGFAVTPKGVQPYIGGGITYSFKSF